MQLCWWEFKIVQPFGGQKAVAIKIVNAYSIRSKRHKVKIRAKLNYTENTKTRAQSFKCYRLENRLCNTVSNIKRGRRRRRRKRRRRKERKKKGREERGKEEKVGMKNEFDENTSLGEREKKEGGRGEKGRFFSVPLRGYSTPVGDHTARHILATLCRLSGFS